MIVLEELSNLHGVSGDEKAVRELILSSIQGNTSSHLVDKIGNLIASKKSHTDKTQPHSVLLCAHMDEVGFFISGITTEGSLKFQLVGGIDTRMLVSKSVISSSGVVGVIGSKAIHLQKTEERNKSIPIDELYIDIGAASKEEAEKTIRIGSYFTFQSSFSAFGQNYLKGKALDDRAGCSIIIDLLQDAYPCDLVAAFTVQEEIGLRGSKVISNYLSADLAIIIEATSAVDYDEDYHNDWSVRLNEGPACSLMDSATLYKGAYIDKIVQLARKHSIPIQFRRSTTAANDAGNIHQARSGIPTITLSLPCRNIHTMHSIISKQDYMNCVALIKLLLNNIEEFLCV